MVDIDQFNRSISTTEGATQPVVAGRMRSHRGNSLNELKEIVRVLTNVGLARKLHVTRTSARSAPADVLDSIIVLEERTMWTKPDFTEMRFGFEITMYIGNR